MIYPFYLLSYPIRCHNIFDYLDNTIHINKVNMYTSGPDSIIKTYNFYDNSNFTAYGILSSAPVSLASTIAFNQTNGTVTIS